MSSLPTPAHARVLDHVTACLGSDAAALVVDALTRLRARGASPTILDRTLAWSAVVAEVATHLPEGSAPDLADALRLVRVRDHVLHTPDCAHAVGSQSPWSTRLLAAELGTVSSASCDACGEPGPDDLGLSHGDLVSARDAAGQAARLLATSHELSAPRSGGARADHLLAAHVRALALDTLSGWDRLRGALGEGGRRVLSDVCADPVLDAQLCLLAEVRPALLPPVRAAAALLCGGGDPREHPALFEHLRLCVLPSRDRLESRDPLALFVAAVLPELTSRAGRSILLAPVEMGRTLARLAAEVAPVVQASTASTALGLLDDETSLETALLLAGDVLRV